MGLNEYDYLLFQKMTLFESFYKPLISHESYQRRKEGEQVREIRPQREKKKIFQKLGTHEEELRDSS